MSRQVYENASQADSALGTKAIVAPVVNEKQDSSHIPKKYNNLSR
jgi:hypothetical protein